MVKCAEKKKYTGPTVYGEYTESMQGLIKHTVKYAGVYGGRKSQHGDAAVQISTRIHNIVRTMR